MDCLPAFLAGFAVCAVGVIVALLFDFGMDMAGDTLKRIFEQKKRK